MESEEVMEGKDKVEDKEGEKAMGRGLELWPKASHAHAKDVQDDRDR